MPGALSGKSVISGVNWGLTSLHGMHAVAHVSCGEREVGSPRRPTPPLTSPQAWGNNIYQLVLLTLGILWSTRSALPVIRAAVPEQRRVLAVYPVLLLYFMLGWIALVSE